MKIRTKISLRTLLLLIAAFACLATIWKLYTDLNIARRDLAELKQKGGHLEVSDEDVIHAVRIPTEDRFKWIYRVHVPNHLELEVYSYGWDFDNGYPKNNKYPKVLGPGEHVLTYTLGSNSMGNSTIDYAIRSPNKTTKSEIQTRFDHSWSANSRACVYTVSPSDFKAMGDRDRWRNFHTLQIDESKPFALMRFGPKDKEGEDLERPGVMVWLNPRKTHTAAQ